MTTMPTILEQKYFSVIKEEISLQEFEQWVYFNEPLEASLGEQAYAELIAFNFQNKSKNTSHDFDQFIDRRELLLMNLYQLLENILTRNDQMGDSIISFYHLYQKGYYFLEDIVMGVGYCIMDTDYEYDYKPFNKLVDAQKEKLLNFIYPRAYKLANELKYKLDNNLITITDSMLRNSLKVRLKY